MADVLVIDDEENYRRMLVEFVEREGHYVVAAATLAEGIDHVRNFAYDVVFLDVYLPDGYGLDILPELMVGAYPPEVIIVTGSDDTESAELALQCGAWDYIRKGASLRNLKLSLSRALQYRESRHGAVKYVTFNTDAIVGHSPAFRAALKVAARAASSDVSVLISGETGTGKELCASAIHKNSARAGGPFVVVDCAALPEALVGSMLFGHERGAFTGAEHRREGLVKQAHGGTLFLDEVGDMPIETQKAFLRVLQERRFRPVGAQETQTSDFRLIAATHRELDKMAEEGTFRRDLLFRLRSVTVPLPPLRDRLDDIELLTSHFVARQCRNLGRDIMGVSESFSEALRGYRWPGNVRELYQAITAAISTASTDPVLYPCHLPVHIRTQLLRAGLEVNGPAEPQAHAPAPVQPARELAGDLGPWRETRAQFEKAYLKELVNRAAHDIETACRISGLSRPHVYALLRKHDLKL